MSEYPPALQAPPAAPPTHTLAITSLIAGVIGLTVCQGLGSVVALVTGYLAREEIRKNPGMYSGEGMATAGIALGVAGVILMCIGLAVALIALFLAFGSMLYLIPVSRESTSLVLPLLALG
jgi:hypothetical protein